MEKLDNFKELDDYGSSADSPKAKKNFIQLMEHSNSPTNIPIQIHKSHKSRNHHHHHHHHHSTNDGNAKSHNLSSPSSYTSSSPSSTSSLSSTSNIQQQKQQQHQQQQSQAAAALSVQAQLNGTSEYISKSIAPSTHNITQHILMQLVFFHLQCKTFLIYKISINFNKFHHWAIYKICNVLHHLI